MTTSPARAAAGAPAAIAAMALFGGCSASPSTGATSTGSASGGSSSSAPAQPAVTRIELRSAGGAVDGGVGRQPVRLGSTVEPVVTSDVADEVHLHGHDKKVDVAAGGAATPSFVANVSGVFAVELESRGTLLARLEVR